MSVFTIKKQQKIDRLRNGFTIIELLIVIVVIGILAAISVVSYRGITGNAAAAVLKSDIKEAAGQLNLAKASDGSFPADTSSLSKSDGTVYQYTVTGGEYCLSVTSEKAGMAAYHISSTTVGGMIEDGLCSGHIITPVNITDGVALQLITDANCPTDRIMAVDARDNHTYWVQKLADGKCWMLTNLAYGGGGANTYNDTKSLTNGTGGSGDLTVATYYIPTSGSNVTIEPTAPSTSTDGSGQYGYLYNWCGAMGGQATAACAAAATPTPIAVSVCPSGWRLPTGNGGEFGALNAAINGGSSSDDSGLRNTWLAQRSGYWASGFVVQGTWGFYWSSINGSALGAFSIFFHATNVNPYYSGNKDNGYAVRCIANN